MAESDPVIGRLDDGLSRVQRIEERAQRGETIPPVILVSEMRAIREDMLAERRDVLLRRSEFAAALQNFLPRQPYQRIGALIVGIIGTVTAGYILVLLTKG